MQYEIKSTNVCWSLQSTSIIWIIFIIMLIALVLSLFSDWDYNIDLQIDHHQQINYSRLLVVVRIMVILISNRAHKSTT